MEMTIDNHIEVLKSYNHGFTGYAGNLQDSIDVAVNIMRKYQMFQADYEARLKADMVAILEDLNLEIDEMFVGRIDYTIDKIQDLIQQKINAFSG